MVASTPLSKRRLRPQFNRNSIMAGAPAMSSGALSRVDVFTGRNTVSADAGNSPFFFSALRQV